MRPSSPAPADAAIGTDAPHPGCGAQRNESQAGRSSSTPRSRPVPARRSICVSSESPGPPLASSSPPRKITIILRATSQRKVWTTGRLQRKKYRCACNGCIDTAPGPVKLQPGSRYSTAFAVEVAVNKYLDHLPLERQARIMRREGLTIDSQTLWDQLDVLAGVLSPTYDALVRHVLKAEVVGADETWWRLMDTKGSKRWWVWSVTREDAVIYKALPSRSQEAARQVLNGYRGIVLADGYAAYDALARAGPSFTLAHCWAHVRRKYVEAEPHYPEPCREALDLIGRLYTVEAEIPAAMLLDPLLREDALDRRRQLRHDRSRP